MLDVRKSVIEIVAATGKVEESSVNEETRLTEDLKLKSVDKISISALLSSKAGATINMFEILKIKTVGELIALTEKKLAK